MWDYTPSTIHKNWYYKICRIHTYVYALYISIHKNMLSRGTSLSSRILNVCDRRTVATTTMYIVHMMWRTYDLIYCLVERATFTLATLTAVQEDL